jgi:hypothetical protein
VARVIAAIRVELARRAREIDPGHYGATLPCRLGEADAALAGRFARAGGQLATGSADAVLARARAYLAAGASKLVLIPLARGTADLFEQLERLAGEVVPALEGR